MTAINDKVVGTPVEASEKDEQEEDPMVLLRESRESNQRLSEEVAQLKAQIEEEAAERSRKRELKQLARNLPPLSTFQSSISNSQPEEAASTLQSKRQCVRCVEREEQHHDNREVQTEVAQ